MSGSVGLKLYRATRTEALARALIETLDAQPPAAVLGVQRVVVAHAGLGRWLMQVLAVYRDGAARPGVAANLLFELPHEWQARVLREQLGEHAIEAGPYRREALRWRILELLPEVTDDAVQGYLGSARPALSAFELADHLAGLYTQYLVYRRDWLLAAEAGQGNHWQAQLWQRLVRRIGRSHRGRQLDLLLRQLTGAGSGADRSTASSTGRDRSSEAVHLFGLNHLPPDTWTLLRGLSAGRAVHLYFVDPVQAYWEDLRKPASELRAGLGMGESPHALVAALGSAGQQFNRQLSEWPQVDEHSVVELDSSSSELLGRFQDSVRRLSPALAGADLSAAASRKQARADSSLRVHVCHTRLRELEVLRDALLDRLLRQPELHPRDIVVMAPDIGAYAELIPAVFGAPGSSYSAAQRRLPYQLADRALGRLHPLLSSFDALLDLPQARLGLSEVLDVLALPAVQRRLGLDAASVQTVEDWLHRSRVAWALDADMKTAFGAAPEPAQTWSWASDRLFLGYLLGDDAEFDSFAGIHALPGVTEPATELLGTLQELLQRLRELRSGMLQQRSLRSWSRWLEARIEALFAADRSDSAESEALAAMYAAAASLAEQADRAALDPVIGWPEVRSVVRELLAQPPLRQSFLGGGITFCGMVPARVIPFEVVCLLGLNDGEFPRPPGRTGLNLIEQQPRVGDRNTRDEDRYLFLEALMAARSALHLSYLGRDPVKDEPRNPASPLAELLEFLDREHRISEPKDRPWQVEHALQPFASRYFQLPEPARPSRSRATRGAVGQAGEPDPALFSFSAHYALRAPATGRNRRPVFVPAAEPTRPSEDAHIPVIELREVLACLRDPSRFSLRRGLKLSLEALDQREPEDHESLEPQFAALDQVPQRLFERARARGEQALPPDPPDWLAGSGLLPPGLAGEQAYRNAARMVDSALQLLHGKLPQLFAASPRLLAVELPGLNLRGRIRAFADGEGWLLLGVRIGKPAEARQLLALFAEYAALRLSFPQAAVRVVQVASSVWRANEAVLDPRPDSWSARTPQRLRQQLRLLLRCQQRALLQPLWFFPYTSWAFANSTPDQRVKRAWSAWHGTRDHPGESHYQPPYAGWQARGRDFLDPADPANAEFVALAEKMFDIVAAP